MKPCTHCQRPTGPGGALGLCARCYRYQHRNGELPPVELLRRAGLTGHLTMHCTPLLVAHVSAAAKRERVTVATWLRKAVEAAVLRGVAKR